MNRAYIVLLTLLVSGAFLAGSALAGSVAQQDLDFVTSDAVQSSTGGGSSDAWSSVGVVSQYDYDFITRDGGVTTVRAPQSVSPVATIEGSDYRFIAGDGTPGATCDIALVAAINPGC